MPKTPNLLIASGLATLVLASPCQADEALAQKSGCLACHAVDHKVVGPAFEDVAAKYAGQDGAVEQLTQKVLNGGSGVWGDVMMPPNVMVSPDNARALVEWVLSLEKS